MRLGGRRLTFSAAKRLCGLDADFEIKTGEDYHFILRVWKEQTVAARRKNDDSRAAELSQCKEVFKRRYHNRINRVCPVCGKGKSAFAAHCQPCSLNLRFYSHTLDTVVMKEHEIEETLVVVGPRCHQTGVLTAVIRKLATTGQVGDSFITDKQSTSVKNVARAAGMECIIRIANPDEKDKKKRRYRVWRSDGLNMEGVNERIKARLAGQTVPPSPPCVAPPPDQLPNRHPKKKAAA